jgi:pimeloyl-ACP methyl ester carboxylesterase
MIMDGRLERRLDPLDQRVDSMNDSRRLRPVTIAVLWLAVATACSSPNDATRSPTPPASPSATTTMAPLGLVSDRCGSPPSDVTLIRFAASDGVELVGFEVGRGEVGIVLGHEYPSDLCDWWTYAEGTAGDEVRMLALDLRCYGDSACPEGAASEEMPDDIAAAARRLRAGGAESLFYMGASMGGTLAFAVGDQLANLFDGVINLSGGGDFADITGSRYVDAPEFAPRVRIPLLSVVARDDFNISVAQIRREFDAVPAQDKRLVVLSGSAHGVTLLEPGTVGAERLPRIILAWIRAHA